MPTQMNFGPPQPGRPAPYRKSEVKHAQSNFDGGRTTKEGGTNKTSPYQNYNDAKAGFGAKPATSYFGEKSGTGSQGGY